MKNNFLYVVLLLFLWIMAGCSVQPSNADFQQVDLVKVIDGDTIRVKINGEEETVRFLLVDTPETNHPQLGEQPFGDEAKEFTKEMLFKPHVELEKDIGDRDKYGRLLRYVYVDGKSVQEALLENGLARVAYVYVPNVKYVDKYRAIQQKAQLAGIGIWSVENYVQEDGFHSDAIANDKAEPEEQGNSDCLIKGNINSKGEKIYHMLGQKYYDRTNAEEMFCTEEEAIAAGYRKAKK